MNAWWQLPSEMPGKFTIFAWRRLVMLCDSDHDRTRQMKKSNYDFDEVIQE
jgi:hypothetical protein